LLPTLVALSLTGCVTQEFVQKEVDSVNMRIAGLEGLVLQTSEHVRANGARIQASEGRLDSAVQSAATLNKRLDETQTDLASANQNVAGLLMGLNAANQHIDANATDIQGARSRLGVVELQLGATSQRVERSMANLALAEGRLGELESAKPSMAPAAEVAAPAIAETVATTAETPAKPVEKDAPANTNATANATTNVQDRLARVDVLIDEVHRRINVNTTTLRGATLRIGELEAGLASAGKRSVDSDAALKAAQGDVGAAQERLAATDKRIEANTHALVQMGSHIDAAAAGLKATDSRLDVAEKRLGEMGEQLARNEAADATISATAKEAMERAMAAGKLAEGKLLLETVLSEEVAFDLEKARLNDAAKQALMTFAEKLKAENQNVFIEVQGHTDNTGSMEANLRLSRQRAEAVRDFLYQEAGMPLHRLEVAAYGETRPIADNKTREGRIKNRRVMLVVLK
jgi:outer membrane protein OmpA-like peptidoglycan-associated protein